MFDSKNINSLIIICLTVFVCSIVFSILYYNLEELTVVKENKLEECMVINARGISEVILVKDCSSVIKTYKDYSPKE